jgi:hypothetical protein
MSCVVSDGLKCFEAVQSVGIEHERVVTGGGVHSVKLPQFKAINTVLGNLKTAIISRPLKKWASNASGTLFSKKRVAQTRLRSDCTGQSGLFAGHLAHFGRTYPRAHA